jgi:ABC-2 type transport system permease protein
MSSAALALHQFRYDQKVFWRNPASVFFTVAFPLVLLFLFELIFGDQTLGTRGGVKASDYYVPAVLALAVIAATLVGLTYRLVEARESGQLKRVRGTPLPTWIFMAGKIGNSLVVSLLMVVVVGALGRLVYGVDVPTSRLPALLAVVVVGAASFSSLGFALAALIPSEDAAPAITNAVTLPLYFISGIFIPESEIPDGVLHVADIFPLRHFFEAFYDVYAPGSDSGLAVGHLAVVVAWGAVGLLVAVRWFRWEPRKG